MVLVAGNEVLEADVDAADVMCVREGVGFEHSVHLLFVHNELLADAFCALASWTGL
jgi:hypothetical protein